MAVSVQTTKATPLADVTNLGGAQTPSKGQGKAAVPAKSKAKAKAKTPKNKAKAEAKAKAPTPAAAAAPKPKTRQTPRRRTRLRKVCDSPVSSVSRCCLCDLTSELVQDTEDVAEEVSAAPNTEPVDAEVDDGTESQANVVGSGAGAGAGAGSKAGPRASSFAALPLPNFSPNTSTKFLGLKASLAAHRDARRKDVHQRRCKPEAVLRHELTTARVAMASLQAALTAKTKELAAMHGVHTTALEEARRDAMKDVAQEIASLKARVLHQEELVSHTKDELAACQREAQAIEGRLRDQLLSQAAISKQMQAKAAAAEDVAQAALAKVRCPFVSWTPRLGPASPHSSLHLQYTTINDERRRLQEMVLDLQGNIRVFCRVRPLLPHESEFTAI